MAVAGIHGIAFGFLWRQGFSLSLSLSFFLSFGGEQQCRPHPWCPADGLMRGEMSREQALSLSFSCSLHLSPPCPRAAKSRLGAVWQWELSGRWFWSSGAQMQGPISGLRYRKICLFTLCRLLSWHSDEKAAWLGLPSKKNTHLAGASWKIRQQSLLFKISPSWLSALSMLCFTLWCSKDSGCH